LLLQQDLVATGSMSGEPHNPLKFLSSLVTSGLTVLSTKANRFQLPRSGRKSRLDRTDTVRQLAAITEQRRLHVAAAKRTFTWYGALTNGAHAPVGCTE
jgi:hypothetical protein